MSVVACCKACRPALLLACCLGTLFLLSSVTAGSSVPKFEPEKWNQAAKIVVVNVTRDQQDIVNYGECTQNGYDSDPSKAMQDSCYYQQEANKTYSYWLKRAGDWKDDSNCYCYALNVYKGGFCVPSGVADADEITCKVLRDGIIKDGAKEVSRDDALSGQPSSGHYIALMARNTSCNPYHCWENDFHAVRKDNNGVWSWKEPAGPVFDTDLFGKKILHPEKQTMFGHYTIFCGYYNVFPDVMKIDGDFSEATNKDEAKEYAQTPGVVAWVESVSYDAAVDGALGPEEQVLLQEDLLWESKRGSKQWTDFYADTSKNNAKSGKSVAASQSKGHRKLMQ